ncbi:uncharacterized protein LOC130561521 [Triplophysa rosa]|uniref:uncharacterized protein LOC130561521 n=1 Tax=Triplophysa rosa TaxID=992332 RepID=UPI002545CB20|nr:uncharacterized protein LOC130561521 [Triplophysa rosa]XP_057201902.1 uncharacterized protein LOC130561521 [Triplophysa rosa]
MPRQAHLGPDASGSSLCYHNSRHPSRRSRQFDWGPGGVPRSAHGVQQNPCVQWAGCLFRPRCAPKYCSGVIHLSLLAIQESGEPWLPSASGFGGPPWLQMLDSSCWLTLSALIVSPPTAPCWSAPPTSHPFPPLVTHRLRFCHWSWVLSRDILDRSLIVDVHRRRVPIGVLDRPALYTPASLHQRPPLSARIGRRVEGCPRRAFPPSWDRISRTGSTSDSSVSAVVSSPLPADSRGSEACVSWWILVETFQ